MEEEQTREDTASVAEPVEMHRWLAWCPRISIVMLVLTLVPLVLISRYDHSFADDWHYAVEGHLALVGGGGLPGVLAAAWAEVVDAWWTWQGTYTAIFLMALEPGVWGENVYVLAAPLIMGCLVASTFFFYHVLIRERLGGGKEAWITLSCITVMLQLMFQPSPVEGIFWYNSAVYYTFFHSLMLVYLAVLVRAIDPARAEKARGAMLASMVLAFLLAGGNFVSVLVSLEITLAILVVVLVRRPEDVTRVVPAFLMLAGCFVFSMAAPGNAIRQETQFSGEGVGVWETIWRSSASGFEYLREWMGGLVVIGALALLPLLLRTAEDAVARGHRFKWPLAVSFASIALFATSFTPTFFSMGTIGPGRVQNCRFDLFVVLFMVNVVWWCGAFARRHADACTPAGSDQTPATKQEAIPRIAHLIDERATAAVMGFAALVIAVSVGFSTTDPQLVRGISSLSALDALVSGQAATYDRQVWRRIHTIESSDSDEVKVAFYQNIPNVLFMGDIHDTMGNYINNGLARWYGKESVVASIEVPVNLE